MRRDFLVFVVIVLAGMGGGCASSKNAAGGEGGATAHAVGDANVLSRLDDDWSAAAATRDAERVASFYADDAVAYPPGEPVAVGRTAAKAAWAAYFAEPSFRISWKTRYAEVAASGDLGFTTGPYEATYNGPDGKPVVEKGKYLCVWKRGGDGAWKAVHDMWNADAR